MKRAAIYTRVSTTDQRPEMQEEELVQYVARRNWTLHKTYSDKVSRNRRKATRAGCITGRLSASKGGRRGCLEI